MDIPARHRQPTVVGLGLVAVCLVAVLLLWRIRLVVANEPQPVAIIAESILPTGRSAFFGTTGAFGLRVLDNREAERFFLLAGRGAFASNGAGASPQEGKSDQATEVLIVNVDPTDPGVPLDLALIVRLFPKERLLEITARVGKHPAFPAEIY